MTRVESGVLPATSVPVWVSRAGVVCFVAGILGAAGGIFLAVYPGQVSEDMFSYPLTAGGFTVIQIWFFVHHFGLLAGIVALAGADVMQPGRSARWGTGVAASGMALLAVTELIAVTARNSTYPGDGTGLLDALYGVEHAEFHPVKAILREARHDEIGTSADERARSAQDG